MVSLIGTAQWGRSNEPFTGASYSFVTDLGFASPRLNRVIDWTEQGMVAAERICNVQYLDLVESPVDVVATVYRHFDIDFPAEARAALLDHLERNPRSARPAHVYEIDDEDEDTAAARKAFSRYQTHFAVPSET